MAPFASILLLGLSGSLFGSVDANAFLKVNPVLREERMTEEDVQTSLLAEVEGTFGKGTASSRVKQLEAILGPIFAALPKNDKGYLGHATVRYALHRLFVQRHGWVIKGLDAAGGDRNVTSEAGLLKEQVPAYIQDLFEQRLAGRGFGLHELGVLAATIEHLVHSEAIKRLGYAFKVHSFLPTSSVSVSEANNILDTYMMSYVLAEDLSNMSFPEALDLKAEMPELYMAWNDTKDFVRTVRQNCTVTEGNAEQQASGDLDFSLMARVAERIGEQFGSFQDQECRQIKASLVKMEEPGTGRVRLSDFYKPAVGGNWQFQESIAYLRDLGALDESDPDVPRVIIPNYMTSPTNCIASSSFYSVCCMDECEGLLGHLERQIAGPEATTMLIAKLVSQLSSSSVIAPRELPTVLIDRLSQIAAQHGGNVPLHGRLFAQWMHHAFPRECSYPHLAGTRNPKTPDEWLEATGEETTATEEEMKDHLYRAEMLPNARQNNTEQEEYEFPSLPWSPEEELLVVRPVQLQEQASSNVLAFVRNLVAFMAVASIAYGFVRSSTVTPKTSGSIGAEKFLV